MPTRRSPYPKSAPWAEPLDAVIAKGREVRRPGGLAGLAAARAEHEGQFFTPTPVAARLWQLVWPSIEALKGVRKVHLLDNSVGSARLFQFADAEHATLAGCDPDERAVAAVATAVRKAGFDADIIPAGMEICHPEGFDVALLNPPFSLTLRSPHLEPGPATTYGPFGPDTSALSQWYALQQALGAARVVAAVLPLQDVERLATSAPELVGEAGHRLVACYRLPARSFRSEGTDVAVGLVLFGPSPAPRPTGLADLTENEGALRVPLFELPERTGRPRLRAVHFDSTKPVITQPVTGDDNAVLHHDGRRLIVKTSCGFTRARVLNALLGDLLPPPEPHENRPRQLRTESQYRLDREFLLAQDDWRAALAEMQHIARSVGVRLDISPTLRGHLRRRARKLERQAAPMGRTVSDPDGLLRAPERSGVITRTLLSDPTRWGAPALTKGTAVRIRSDEVGGWIIASDALDIPATEAQLKLHVELEGALPSEQSVPAGWVQVSPDLIDQEDCATAVLRWRERLYQQGADRWLWDYQFEDCADLLTKPQGAIAGWHTGLGKARLAAAVALAHQGKQAVVVVPARLVPELAGEWESLPLPENWWKVVRSPADLDWNVPVMIIAAEHLRSRVAPNSRRTLATLLRRRVSLLVVDEADFMANPNSQQTQAIWQISARRRVLLTATPIANYPRDVFPLIALAAGDGTAAQPYGWYRPECTAAGWSHAQLVRSGRDAIREDFVTLAWVTNEFADTLREGAKREIPIIKDLPKFRAALSPVIKRRVHSEPAVRRYIQVPEPHWEAPRVIEWDDAHLAHFLKVADEFASWYAEYRKKLGEKNSSLVTLLARIGAVERAGNDPMHATREQVGRYPYATSKQRAVVRHLMRLTSEGHRSITYARHPATLEWMARALAAEGVQSVVLHGGRSIAKRTAALERDFRRGDASVILATFGTGDRGLNLPQASHVILLDRDWSARTERQCIGRTLRSQQKAEPRVQPFHLPGSLDEYMAQLTHFKAEAADAGVDWGTPILDPDDFLHLDTVVERFVTDIAARRGLTRREFREELTSSRESLMRRSA